MTTPAVPHFRIGPGVIDLILSIIVTGLLLWSKSPNGDVPNPPNGKPPGWKPGDPLLRTDPQDGGRNIQSQDNRTRWLPGGGGQVPCPGTHSSFLPWKRGFVKGDFCIRDSVAFGIYGLVCDVTYNLGSVRRGKETGLSGWPRIAYHFDVAALVLARVLRQLLSRKP
jgi:hypothetical protein